MNIQELQECVVSSIQRFESHREFYSQEASLQFLLANELNNRNLLITTEFKINKLGKIDIVIGEVPPVYLLSKIGIELKFYYATGVRYMGNDQALHCFLDIAKAKKVLCERSDFSKFYIIWIFTNEIIRVDENIINYFNSNENIILEKVSQFYGPQPTTNSSKNAKHKFHMRGYDTYFDNEVHMKYHSNYNDYQIRIIEVSRKIP